MSRKIFLPLFLTGFLIVFGWMSRRPQAASTSTPLPSPTSSPAPTLLVPTPYPDKLEAWLDEAIIPDQFGDNDSLIVHFNQPMNPKSAAVPLTILPILSGDYVWNEDFTTLTFTPSSKLSPSVTYRFSPARYLASVSGKTFASQNVWFITREAPGRIVSRQPSGSVLPLETKAITLVFSHEMDRTSVENAFSVQPTIPVSFSWDKKTLKITLDMVFKPDQEFQFALGEGAKTAAGKPITGLEWTYRTPSLQVEFARVTGLSRRTPFTLSFNYPVDPDRIESALTVVPDFAYDARWDTSKKVLTLTSNSPLASATLFTFSLVTKDMGLEGFSQPQTWTYISPALNTTFNVEPAADRRPALIFTSNLALDPETTANALQIEPAFEYTLVWNTTNTIFKINPTQPLPSLTQYTIRFAGEILDAEGFPLSGLGVHRFTTPSPIANEPKVGYGSSRNYSYYGPQPMAPEADLFILFDRPMEPETTFTALTITPTIPGEIVWLAPDKLQVIPDAGHLAVLTKYALTLAPTALDAEGNPVLSKPYTWNILTSDFPSKASFGEYGANVQVVDLDGRRAIQIAASSGLESVHLELYRITLAQFIQFDANTFVVPWGNYREKPPFDLSGAVLAKSWDSEVVYASGENVYNKAAEIYLPEGLEEGLYVINLHTDHLDDQMLLVASRSTIALQYNNATGRGGELSAWVSNINGHVMTNVDVRVYDRAGAQIGRGVTNAIGVFKTTLPVGAEPYLVVARRDGGITVAGVGGVWGTRGYGGVRRGTADVYLAYLYTERPIYRPGQTVNYKGIVRLDNDVNFRLPGPDLAATLNIRDARKNLIATRPIAFNEFGTFNGSFDIASGAMLGDYQLELVIYGESHSQSFKVQDYKKPDIAVTVSTDQAEYVTGETISVTVDTRYLFGEPVANASLAVKTYELIPFYCCMWYDYPNGGAGEYRWFPSENEKTLTADENGIATFTLPATIGPYTQDYSYYDFPPKSTHWGIEVTADDGSNQEISSFTTIIVHATAAEVNIQLGGWLYNPSAPVPVTLALASVFGDPVSGRNLKLIVEKRSDRYWEYNSYQAHDLTTGENGLAHLALNLENGAYKLTLTGKDSRGNPLRAIRYLYVFESESTWLLDYTTQLSLAAEDRDYAAGDTAQIIVETSISGQGLLTLARGGVFEQRLVQLEAPITVLNIPVRAEYAPNIFVTVQAWNPLVTDLTQYEWAYESIPDSILRWDAFELRVPDTAHRLTVEITPDQTEYAPREEATFTVRVTDVQGNPVRAELSLALVDEAIFLLADDPAGDIHDAFYVPRRLSLFFSDSLAPWRYLWFDEGGQGGGEDNGAPGTPRSDFPDTALWIPTLVTNADGEAAITVSLPDSLTSWRLTVKAVTQDSRIGEGQTNLHTQQPVIIRPLPPRNLTAGDNFILSALVHNVSDEMLNLTVSAKTDGLELTGEVSQRILLNPGEARVVAWPGTAAQAGDTSFTLTAIAPGGVGDAIQMHIPVQPLVIPVIHSESGQFTGTERVYVFPETGALPESGVRVQVDATLAGSLLNGVEFLTGYPYGCVEQTMSRALPNAVIARAFEHLGLSERADLLALDSKLAASVQRLYAFQHDDGGWGWWFDDPSDGYQTAWVVFGLAVTAESGYPVDFRVLERGVKYLKAHLDEMNAPTRAFAVYAMAMAGFGDVELALDQVANMYELDLFSRASIALTLHTLGEETIANEILDDILSAVVVAPNGEVWASGARGDGYYDRKLMASDVRTTAMVLQALMALRPGSDLRPGMVQWLQTRRTLHGWGTTNETAFTLLGLTDHLLAQQNEVANETVSVYLNQVLLVTGTLSTETPTIVMNIPVAALQDGENEIRLETDAENSLYFAVGSEMFVRQSEIAGNGLPITRTYLDPETKAPVTAVREGDLVLVRLTVNLPAEAYYLMITDHLPGGLEALNEGLNITGHDTAVTERMYWDYGWDWFSYDDYGYNNKEIWPDRVLFFVTQMGKGQRTFEYYARATVSGTFTALPTEVEGMYDVNVWGRSASETFVVLASLSGRSATQKIGGLVD